ncbi:MAG: alpha/beta hydrolase [Proteobacteria bacterium]|nr:alpha/beta hydrolase [Pseudomonadota bacterium]
MSVAINPSELSPGKNAINFKSQGFKVAAHLYLPEAFDGSGNYPGVVFGSPGLSIKEQSGGVYGPALAKRGYAVLVFDRLGFGQSEGPFPRCLNPGPTNELHLDAISFLRAQPFVDRAKFFGLGICVGSIDITKLAFGDKRLKAIATISGIVGTCQQFYSQPRENVVAALAAANEERQRQYETGEMTYADSIGTPEAVADMPPESTVRQGVEYYKGIASEEVFPGYSTMSPGNFTGALPYFDVMSMAPKLYTPYLGIAGSLADTREDTEEFYKAASDPKELYIVEGATHVDLYHKPNFVEEAADQLDTFYRKHGG